MRYKKRGLHQTSPWLIVAARKGHARLAFLLAGGLVLAALGTRPAAAQSIPEPVTVGLGLADVVHVTLELSYAIRIQSEQIRFDEGSLSSVTGAFDPFLSASVTGGREDTPLTAAQRQLANASLSKSGFSTYRLGMSKQFRSGFSVSPGVEVSRSDALGTDAAPLISTRASLLVNVPLMRGRGTNLASAQVDAAETALQASELTFRHTSAQGLLQAVYAYWAYLSANRQLGILNESEERARQLLSETQALVEAGERPSADLDQLRANLADKITARIRAEQAHFEARQSLGLAMGLTFEQIERIPAPTEDFPAVAGVMEALPSAQVLTDYALRHRHDLGSAREQEDASLSLFRAARAETRPRLDLQLDLGYSGLSEGGQLREYLPPIGQNDVSGPSAFVSFVYSLPTGNHSARGLRMQQEAAYTQSRLAADDLMRQVSSGVAVATAALQRSVLELSKAREAIGLYLTTVENEKKKLRLGMSTLFDVIIVEDRLRNAQLSEVTAQVRYAQALARLRFETGALIIEGGDLAAQVEALTTIPLVR